MSEGEEAPKTVEDSMLSCADAFFLARKVMQHYPAPHVEVELRISSKLSAEDFAKIAQSLTNAQHETDWINIYDSHGKSFRKSVINGKRTIIEKKLVQKETFSTNTGVMLSLTAKTEIPCEPSLLCGMQFEVVRKKVRKSFTYGGVLRFDLTVVWTQHDGVFAKTPEYEVEVELLPPSPSFLLTGNQQHHQQQITILTGHLLDAGVQLVKALHSKACLADLKPERFKYCGNDDGVDKEK